MIDSVYTLRFAALISYSVCFDVLPDILQGTTFSH